MQGTSNYLHLVCTSLLVRERILQSSAPEKKINIVGLSQTLAAWVHKMSTLIRLHLQGYKRKYILRTRFYSFPGAICILAILKLFLNEI